MKMTCACGGECLQKEKSRIYWKVLDDYQIDMDSICAGVVWSALNEYGKVFGVEVLKTVIVEKKVKA